MSPATLALFTLLAVGADPPAVHQLEKPYVTVNLGVELHALEEAANDTAQATRELAKAVGSMAGSPALSEEQKAQLMSVLGRVDTLSERVVTAVDRLPSAVQESAEPLTGIATDLASQIRWTLVLVILLLVLVVLAALVGVYFVLLRPTKRMMAETIGRFQSLAEALQRTAELVGESTEAQTALAERLASVEASTASAGDPGEELPSTA